VEQPRPFGMWAVRHIVVDLDFSSTNYFRQVLLEPGCPKLAPTMRAGGMNLYSDAVYQEWKEKFLAWREGAAARAAARRKQREEEARQFNSRVADTLAEHERKAAIARAERAAAEEFEAQRERERQERDQAEQDTWRRLHAIR